MKKKCMAACLSLLLILGAVPLSTGNALGNFTDIADSATAGNVEILQMMGVVNGDGAGMFRPNAALTRAEFCKMAVVIMGNADAVARYRGFTIFPDVTATHWAAGYINLAVRGSTKLIAGNPDGSFAPDKEISYGEAITILLRLLGYSDADAGVIWPDGYLSIADGNGLSEGLALPGNASLTRAQAAQLFVNLLYTKTKGGSTYAAAIGQCSATAILLPPEEDTPNHLRLSTGESYEMENPIRAALTEGQRGMVVSNENGRAIAFLPERNSRSAIIQVSTAKADSLLDIAGNSYKVDSSAKLFYQGTETTYTERRNVLPGRSVTLFFGNSGAVEYIFAGGTIASTALIVQNNGSTEHFSNLSGGMSSYQLYKNGSRITKNEIRRYDVATYDAATRSIELCDTRIVGYIEKLYPNRNAATQVTMLGHTFDVLPSAAGDFAAIPSNGIAVLLLTKNNQVAGVVAADGKASNTAYGYVTVAAGDFATVELFCGITVSGICRNDVTELAGKLVSVSSAERDRIVVTKLHERAVTDDLDVAARTLGTMRLSDGVRIYEKVGDSALRKLAYTDLNQGVIPRKNIASFVKDSADRVTVVVLENYTGDSYVYGKMTPGIVEQESVTDDDGLEWGGMRYHTLRIENSSGSTEDLAVMGGRAVENGYGGVVVKADGSGMESYLVLQKLDDVPLNTWVGGNDDGMIVANGVSYPIAEAVECYDAAADMWMTVGDLRFNADTADFYYDRAPEENGKIRVIVINE